MRYLSKSITETATVAASALSQLLPPQNHAAVMALYGDLGSGKTTFVQQLAGVLGVSETVSSPTFVLIKTYKLPDSKQPSFDQRPPLEPHFYKYFFHIDAYRLERAEELLPLGWKGIVANPQNLIVIEWADKIETLLPPQVMRIKFRFIDNLIREIEIIS